MKQPILFQSHVVDFEDIREQLDIEVLSEMDGSLSSTYTHYLYHYLRHASYEQIIDLHQVMRGMFDVEMRGMRYTQLNVPVVVDLETGEAFQVRNVDYSPTKGAIMSVLVEDGAELRFIYNKGLYVPEGSYGTTLKILNDGWV